MDLAEKCFKKALVINTTFLYVCVIFLKQIKYALNKDKNILFKEKNL
jgi:hypothetical protein